MIIRVVRKWYFEDATLGELYIDDSKPFGFTCEDKVRSGPKIPGGTAIPAGVYAIKVKRSPSWHRDMPYLDWVPNYTGVMIHPGNGPDDTRGCVLVGCRIDLAAHRILESRVCFDALFPRIKAGETSIEIVDEPIVDERSSHV